MGGGGEVTGSDRKIGDGRWGEGQTDEANIALLFLSRQSHACSTPRIWERAGLHAFCLTHTAILCPSGFKSWQWTCCLCFCSSHASSACSCTTRAPSTGEGRGIPTAVLHPQHPAAPFLLQPPATRGNGRTSRTPKHFTHTPLAQLRPVPQPCPNTNPALPAHQAISEGMIHHNNTSICNKLGKLSKCTPYANCSSIARRYFERKRPLTD